MDTENDNKSNSNSNSTRGTIGSKKIVMRPRRMDYPRKDREHQEEYATDITPAPMQTQGTNATSSRTNGIQNSEESLQDSQLTGYVGLAFGVASLFFWSIILGPLAAVIGYYAYVKEQKTLGAWAIGLGIVSTLSYFVMIPFVR